MPAAACTQVIGSPSGLYDAPSDPALEHVVAAALSDGEDRVYLGDFHNSARECARAFGVPLEVDLYGWPYIEGFWTSKERFVTREEAKRLASKANQLRRKAYKKLDSWDMMLPAERTEAQGDLNEYEFSYVLDAPVCGGYPNATTFYAKRAGETVGELCVAPSLCHPGKLYVSGVKVQQDHRRKGIATRLYQMAERHFNMKFVAGGYRSSDGKAFRQSYDGVATPCKLEALVTRVEGEPSKLFRPGAPGKEYLVAAAIMGPGGVVTLGDYHEGCYEKTKYYDLNYHGRIPGNHEFKEGFWTSKKRFVGRAEATRILRSSRVKRLRELESSSAYWAKYFCGRLLGEIGVRTLQEEVELVATDRYQALGIPYPDPETVCAGQCEGTGYVPIKVTDMREPWHSLWLKAEAEKPTDDGWHFVKCPDCGGTGKRRK